MNNIIMTNTTYINTNIPGEITMLGAPSLPFVKLLYIINDITTTPNRFFYIDNTDPDEPFLAYDSDPVENIYVRFTGTCPSLKGKYSSIIGTYYVSNKGTDLTIAEGLFRENGTANIYYNYNNIKFNLGTLILYENQGKRRVYVKINWNGDFFDQWKRIAIYDEFNYLEPNI